jgi:hypothetical protein
MPLESADHSPEACSSLERQRNVRSSGIDGSWAWREWALFEELPSALRRRLE